MCTCLERETPRWALTALVTDWEWGLLTITPSPQCQLHASARPLDAKLLTGLVRDVTLLCGARPVQRPVLANRLLYQTPVSGSYYVTCFRAFEQVKTLIFNPLCRDLVSHLRLPPPLPLTEAQTVWLGPCLEMRLNLGRAYEKLTRCPARGPRDPCEYNIVTEALERVAYTPSPLDRRVLCLCRHLVEGLKGGEVVPTLWPLDGSVSHVSAEFYAALESRLREKGYAPEAFAEIDSRWGPRFNSRGKRVTADVYLTAAFLALLTTGVDDPWTPPSNSLYQREINVWDKIGRVLKRIILE
nr:ORF2 [Acipenserid herpesvirus 1]